MKRVNSKGWCGLYCSECFLWLQRHIDSSAVHCCAVCFNGSMYATLKQNIKYAFISNRTWQMCLLGAAGLFHLVNMHLLMNIQGWIVYSFNQNLKTKPGNILQLWTFLIRPPSRPITLSFNDDIIIAHQVTAFPIICFLLTNCTPTFTRQKSILQYRTYCHVQYFYPQCQSSGIPTFTSLFCVGSQVYNGRWFHKQHYNSVKSTNIQCWHLHWSEAVSKSTPTFVI